MDHVAAYRSTRERCLDLAQDLTPDEIGRTVLPTPAWTVKDTYAHMVGAAADLLSGNLEGLGSEAWTAAQVTARADATLEEICQEWMRIGPEFEAHADPKSLSAGTWTHEQDIRGSLGLKGVGDTGGMEATLEQVERIGPRLDDSEVAGLRIEAGDRSWLLGSASPEATLRTTPYLLARLVYGRRSPAQVKALDWDGDPGPYLDHLGHYGLAARDITD